MFSVLFLNLPVPFLTGSGGGGGDVLGALE